MVDSAWLPDRFRNAGFKLTWPRQAILNVFAKKN